MILGIKLKKKKLLIGLIIALSFVAILFLSYFLQIKKLNNQSQAKVYLNKTSIEKQRQKSIQYRPSMQLIYKGKLLNDLKQEEKINHDIVISYLFIDTKVFDFFWGKRKSTVINDFKKKIINSWEKELVTRKITFEDNPSIEFDPMIKTDCYAVTNYNNNKKVYFPTKYCESRNSYVLAITGLNLENNDAAVSLNRIWIDYKNEDFFNKTIKHEIGHILGVTDLDKVEVEANAIFPAHSKKGSVFDDLMYSWNGSVSKYTKYIINHPEDIYPVVDKITFTNRIFIENRVSKAEFIFYENEEAYPHRLGKIKNTPTCNGSIKNNIFFIEQCPLFYNRILDGSFPVGFVIVKAYTSSPLYFWFSFDMIDLTMAKIDDKKSLESSLVPFNKPLNLLPDVANLPVANTILFEINFDLQIPQEIKRAIVIRTYTAPYYIFSGMEKTHGIYSAIDFFNKSQINGLIYDVENYPNNDPNFFLVNLHLECLEQTDETKACLDYLKKLKLSYSCQGRKMEKAGESYCLQLKGERQKSCVNKADFVAKNRSLEDEEFCIVDTGGKVLIEIK